MNMTHQARTVRLTVLAASLWLAFGTASAEEDEVLRLIRPDSSVLLGAGYLTEDAARFGQYNGLKDMGLYAIGDLRYVRRDDQTGTWVRLDGRNLGFESREVRFEHDRQGDWRYFLEYSKTPRFSPYTVNTGLQGIGSTDQQIVSLPRVNGVPQGGRDIHLKTVRESVSFGGGKFLGGGVDIQVRFKNETKQGDRLFGRGTSQQSFQQFLAEPIDHTMQQVDVVLGYTAERLQLSGGYYGSFFKNDHPGLRVTPFSGADQTLIAALSPIALPPDNQAHQFHLAGGFSFTPTTRANFKLARTVATQNDRFIVPARPEAGRSNLGGRVETTLAQVGFSARPIQKLSLLGSFKYEDRDDKTPVRSYFTSSGNFSGTNEPRSVLTKTGKLEASYRLPAEFRLTGGVDYDAKRRNTYDRRLVTFRRETEEVAHRIELARSLAETLNGSVAYVRSERTGSSFDKYRAGSLAVANQFVAPVHLADRDREKVRFKLDWVPIDPLSIQVLADFTADDYGGGAFGLDKGRGSFLSLDGSYQFSEEWQGLAWASREYSRVANKSRTGSNNWRANLPLLTQAAGIGVRGKIGEQWQVGGDLQYQHDESRYAMISASPTVNPSLPDVKYTLTTVKIFTEYQMRKDLALRLDAAYEWWNTNDWLWTNYIYSDGTRLSQDRTQETAFIGVSMRYNWR